MIYSLARPEFPFKNDWVIAQISYNFLAEKAFSVSVEKQNFHYSDNDYFDSALRSRQPS